MRDNRGGSNRKYVYIYQNGKLVESYDSITATVKAKNISLKTLYRLLDTGIMYKGYEWRLTVKPVEIIIPKLSWIQRLWHNLTN